MTDFLLISFVFLVAGVIAVPVASKLSLGSVLGYLIAGIVISPLLFVLKVDVVSIQHFAEFGVVMMLFIVGLELEPKMLWSMRNQLLGLGGGQVLVTSTLIALALIVVGLTWQYALTLGLIFALSSTAIVLQTLQEKGLLKTDGGKASFSVLLTQDIAVIPMLALIPLLAVPELFEPTQSLAVSQANDHSSSLSLVNGLAAWQSALITLGMIALVIVGGNYLTAPLFRFVALARLRELFTATALLFVVGISLMMSLVGLSPALGTFLAGVVLANSAYKHELESNIDPFKGLLLGLFFITVGASINFSLLSDNLLNVVLLTIGLIAIKLVVLLILGRLFGLRGSENWLLAFGLAQAGEFGFVLLSFTVANNVLPQNIADNALLVVTLSMLLSPLLFIVYQRWVSTMFQKSEDTREEAFPQDNKIIIAGSGRVGGLVDRIIQSAGFNTTVIDHNYKQLEAMQRVGVRYYFGDATRPDLLSAAGISEASLLVVALDDAEQITKLVRYALLNYPHLHVIARAVDRHHVYELYAYGCRDIIRETYDSSLRIGRSAFEALGIPKERAEKMVSLFDSYDKNLLHTLANVFEVGVPFEENHEYVEKVKSLREEKEPEVKKAIQALKDG